MGLPPQLQADLADLRERGFSVTAQRQPEDGQKVLIVFDHYDLPPGWTKRETRLLLISDVSYPNSKLDMFWVDVDLMLKSGSIPEGAGTVETHLGQAWRRFSWHVQRWNPAHDSVVTYLDTVNARLRRLE